MWKSSVCLLLGLVVATLLLAKEPTILRRVEFVEHRIARNVTAPHEISTADLDGDGDRDILCGQHLSRNSFLWFDNLGQERFQARFLDRDSPERFARHCVGDLDGDGRPDIVGLGNTGGAVLWLRNPGPPPAPLPSGERPTWIWTRHWIADAMPRAYDGLLADIDGDKDLDFVAWSQGPDHHVAWYENRGQPTAPIWTRHLAYEDLPESAALQAVDMDRDGDFDLLATAGNGGQVFWLENRGTPVSQSWRKHEIARLPSPALGQAVDVDADGDVDVVLAVGLLAPVGAPGAHQVIWLENPAIRREAVLESRPSRTATTSSDELRLRETDWPRHVISARLTGAIQAIAGDIDNDGDVDVIAASTEDPGNIVWFEQRRVTTTYWLMHNVLTGWRNIRQIRLADLDGDRRLDLIAVAGPGSDELRWWKNEPRLVSVILNDDLPDELLRDRDRKPVPKPDPKPENE